MRGLYPCSKLPAAPASRPALRPPPLPLPRWQQRHHARARSLPSNGDSSHMPPADLLQRVQSLRARQAELEAEAEALAAALEGLPAASQRVVLEALAEQRQAEQQQQQPTADGSGTPGWLAELPSSLQQTLRDSGLVPALEAQAAAVAEERTEREGDEQELGGEAMEALARIVEEGGQLPPLPDSEWLREPEPAGEFRARVQGSIAYCKTPLKASKHFRGPAPSAEQDPEAAAAAAAAAQHTASPQAVAAAVAYSRDCAEAAAYARGWEQAREWDRRWKAGEVGGYPDELAEEVPKSIPAPELPPEAETVYRAAERLAYVLRRAHMDSDAPDAPLLALQAKGLLSEELLLLDPFVEQRGVGGALGYLERLRHAGATLETSTIMARCARYEPVMRWSVTIDCFLHLPYPAWFSGWVELNQDDVAAAASSAGASSTASSAASSAAPAGPRTAAAPAPAAAAAATAGPLRPVSAAAIDAAESAGAAAREQANAEDGELLCSMLEAAMGAAAAAGQPLDDEGKMAVLLSAAGIAVRRRQEKEAARTAAANAARDAAAAADAQAEAEEERWAYMRRLGGAAAEVAAEEAAAAAAAAERDPASPQLLEVHSEPYVHEGHRRQHRWVLLDFEQQHRQRRRQRFDVYPRHPPAAGAAVLAKAAVRALEEMSDEELEAEQQRRYQLLPTAGLAQQGWGRERQQPAPPAQQQHEHEQPGPPAQQQQQQQSQDGGSAASAAASSGRKKKRRAGAAGPLDGDGQPPDEHHAEEVEELFPFTFDWEKQRRRREAGRTLRQLMGNKFDSIMGQVPRLGRTRGKGSNSALNNAEEQEGSAWLGGQGMTVNVTYNWTLDPDTLLADTCTLTWGSVHGLYLREPADAFDIWLEATGLLHEAECDQDEEQGAALGWQPEAPGSNGQGDGRPEGFGRHASWRPVWLQQQGP